MATVRIIVIGTGSIGARHLSIFDRLDGVEVIALPVRSANRQRAQELERQDFRVAETLEEAISLEPAGVVVATETARHLSDLVAVASFASIRAVLVEKPLAVSFEGVENALQQARARGTAIQIGCNLRFHPAVQRARTWLDRLGAPHSACFFCHSFLPDWRSVRDHKKSYSASALQGGVLRDLVHEVDLATWLLGWPERVFGKLRNIGRLGIESEEVAEVSYDVDECAVTIHLDYLSRPTRRGFSIYGESGTLVVDLTSGTVMLSGPCGQDRAELPTADRDETYTTQAEHFVALLKGDPSEIAAGGRNGSGCVALVDAARRSSDSGKVEPLDASWKGPS